jgi:hypothetical protein
MGSCLPLTLMVSCTCQYSEDHVENYTNLGEVHQDLSHLVTSLTTADIHDNVTVGELGQRLRNDSLAASKSTGNADCATLDAGEERVQDTLADDKRLVG